MLLVLVGTNLLFPPVPPEQPPVADSVGGEPVPPPSAFPPIDTGAAAPSAGEDTAAVPEQPSVETPAPSIPERSIAVRSPLYEFEFSNRGAVLTSAELPEFLSTADGNLDLFRCSATVGTVTSRSPYFNLAPGRSRTSS